MKAWHPSPDTRACPRQECHVKLRACSRSRARGIRAQVCGAGSCGKHLTPPAWRSTNTSALFVARLSGVAGVPGKFCGFALLEPCTTRCWSRWSNAHLPPLLWPHACEGRRWEGPPPGQRSPGITSTRLGVSPALGLEARAWCRKALTHQFRGNAARRIISP